MNQEFITCALCGHRFPTSMVRSREDIVCSCGMRIHRPAEALPRSRTSAVTILLLAAAILLFTAVAALARRLTG